jgi:hypothetical protein
MDDERSDDVRRMKTKAALEKPHDRHPPLIGDMATSTRSTARTRTHRRGTVRVLVGRGQGSGQAWRIACDQVVGSCRVGELGGNGAAA